MKTPPVIAIDGPSASGKGTLARRLARHFGFAYLDTGLLYRAVGLAVLRQGGDPGDADQAAAAAVALTPANAGALDDPALRGDQAAQAASRVAAVPAVRAALKAFQQSFAAAPPAGAGGAVLDGRDIGTVICPGADAKLFVTASLAVRTQRRLDELRGRGVAVEPAAVLADMTERDARDSQRSVAPLVAAADAVVLDTSMLDAEQAFAAALDQLSRRFGLAAGPA
ncbi:MAG: (d)CMP kinase [Azospirillum sp.]|nr:(d)CMP kinase [Azospirillum sp.]